MNKVPLKNNFCKVKILFVDNRSGPWANCDMTDICYTIESYVWLLVDSSGRKPDLLLPAKLKQRILSNLEYDLREVRDGMHRGGKAGKKTISLTADLAVAMEEDASEGRDLSLGEFLEASAVVAYILGEADATRYPALLAHQKIVGEIAQRYDWGRAKAYDADMRLHRARAGSYEEADAMFPWTVRAEEVFRQSEQRDRAGPLARAPKLQKVQGPQRRGPGGGGGGTCKRFNQFERCGWGAKCHFAHLCVLCSGPHPVTKCESVFPGGEGKSAGAGASGASGHGGRHAHGASGVGGTKGLRTAGVP